MDSSRRAVESYWRSKMIDGATSDEDKVAPVYKLEEICDLLRSSHLSIVKEVSEFILRRLQHKSPIVKQKALRLIKYAVGKSGVEFRREMQRNSVAVRQLIHHKGQPDPLKGDALNKAVRDTAQEALSAIFAGDDNNKPAPTESALTQRIQGFGNTNFDSPSEDKKSFLSEVVGIGSATIKLGLTSLTQTQSQNKNDTGSYRSPNLRRSLTTESSYSDRNESYERRTEAQSSSLQSKNVSGGSWGQDLKTTVPETANGNPSSSYSGDKSREERLLETIVTSGGVRLQPTRDVLQVFVVEASKLNAVALSQALELKLQSPLWQVRMKAICVLEAMLRKKDDEHFSIVASYFVENKDVVVKCSESPQASLREKANKVLGLLNGEQSGSGLGQQVKMEAAVQLPDLIDTYDSYGSEESTTVQKTEGITSLSTSNTSLIDDFFDDGFSSSVSNSEPKNNDDPFSDVSFHTQASKEEHVAADLFSGMSTVDEPGVGEGLMALKGEAELFDIFGSNSGLPQAQENAKKDLNDLMAGLSVNANDSLQQQNRASAGAHPETIFPDSTVSSSNRVPNDVLNGILTSQGAGMNANPLFPLNSVAYNNLPSGLVLNPMAFPTQPINYGAMGNLFAQQQFLATMSSLQHMGNLPSQPAGAIHTSGTQVGGYPSALPDIFNPSIPAHTPSSLVNSSKKEETRAFDFISDHIAAARDPKRVN